MKKRLITLSPSEGKWNGNWNTQYNVSLRDLQLEDLVESGPANARVAVDLSVQRVIEDHSLFPQFTLVPFLHFCFVSLGLC